MISDLHSSLAATLRRSFQGASWSTMPSALRAQPARVGARFHTNMVAAVFHTTFAQPNVDAVAATRDQVGDQLAARFPKISTLMDSEKTEVLAFTGFQPAHW